MAKYDLSSSSVLTRILNRVRKWEEMGKVRSFAKQTEIKLGLDESYQELRACSMRFNVRCAPLHSFTPPSDYSLQYGGAAPPTHSISRGLCRSLCIWMRTIGAESSKRPASTITTSSSR